MHVWATRRWTGPLLVQHSVFQFQSETRRAAGVPRLYAIIPARQRFLEHSWYWLRRFAD